MVNTGLSSPVLILFPFFWYL